MAPIYIVLLSVADIVLYTVRSYTNKLFAISYEGKSSMATPIFSTITGFSGFLYVFFSHSITYGVCTYSDREFFSDIGKKKLENGKKTLQIMLNYVMIRSKE